MPSEVRRSNLGDWQNPPVIQDQVIAYMESIAAPMLLREIYHPLRLPKEIVNRVLGRLHAKGVLTRYKIPVQRHRPDEPGFADDHVQRRHLGLEPLGLRRPRR